MSVEWRSRGGFKNLFRIGVKSESALVELEEKVSVPDRGIALVDGSIVPLAPEIKICLCQSLACPPAQALPQDVVACQLLPDAGGEAEVGRAKVPQHWDRDLGRHPVQVKCLLAFHGILLLLLLVVVNPLLHQLVLRPPAHEVSVADQLVKNQPPLSPWAGREERRQDKPCHRLTHSFTPSQAPSPPSNKSAFQLYLLRPCLASIWCLFTQGTTGVTTAAGPATSLADTEWLLLLLGGSHQQRPDMGNPA